MKHLKATFILLLLANLVCTAKLASYIFTYFYPLSRFDRWKTKLLGAYERFDWPAVGALFVEAWREGWWNKVLADPEANSVYVAWVNRRT